MQQTTSVTTKTSLENLLSLRNRKPSQSGRHLERVPQVKVRQLNDYLRVTPVEISKLYNKRKETLLRKTDVSKMKIMQKFKSDYLTSYQNLLQRKLENLKEVKEQVRRSLEEERLKETEPEEDKLLVMPWWLRVIVQHSAKEDEQ